MNMDTVCWFLFVYGGLTTQTSFNCNDLTKLTIREEGQTFTFWSSVLLPLSSKTQTLQILFSSTGYKTDWRSHSCPDCCTFTVNIVPFLSNANNNNKKNLLLIIAWGINVTYKIEDHFCSVFKMGKRRERAVQVWQMCVGLLQMFLTAAIQRVGSQSIHSNSLC